MAGYGAERKGRRRRSGRLVLIAVLLMCAAIFIGLCAFLRISDIEVVGTDKYAPEDIEAASGIETGDSMLLVRSSGAAVNICRKFPYIEDVRISRKLPGTLVINVTESSAVAYVEADGGFWKIDKNCRLLERTEGDGLAGLIKVVGVTPVSPSEGKPLSLGLEEESKGVYLKSILRGISDNSLQGKVGRLDAENIARLGFTYGDNLTVFLGSGAEIDAKFNMLMRILEDCADSYGTIDVSDPDEGHFIPA